MATVTPALGAHGHADDHAHGHHEQTFISKYVFSVDHKVIGIQFLVTTLLMLMVGGALALAGSLATGVSVGKHADRRKAVRVVSE